MKKIKNQKTYKREVRQKRIRAKVFGSNERPRLSVFRSNKHIYAQIIDDDSGKTLAAASDAKMSGKKTKIEKATEVGKIIAQVAIAKHVKKVTFDRGGFIFTGRVKALAEASRQAGLEF